jgi:hypothetical protein
VSKCRHTYKPVVRAGPSYVFGMYAGIDHFGTDFLACTKCGHRRRPALSVIAQLGAYILWGALWLIAATLLSAIAVMCLRMAWGTLA